MRHLARALGFLLFVPGMAIVAADFPWKARFTPASSPTLIEIHEQVHAAHPESLLAFRADNLVWSEEDFRLEIASGTIYLEPPVQGRIVGAFFEGRATFSFAPRMEGPQGSLRTHLGKATIDRVPVDTAYIFTLRPDSPLTSPGKATPAPAKPSRERVYIADKSAMRQLGLDLTAAFLNKDGPAKGATYILLPMVEIRGAHSPDVRALYRFNPTTSLSVALSIFGHDELVALKPYKHRFYSIVSYGGRKEGLGVADVERSSVKVTPGVGTKPASEEATLDLNLSPGARALRLNYTVRMEVSDVKGSDGQQIPFLQWEWLRTLPDFDETLLLLLADRGAPAAGLHAAMTVKSAGLLFERVGSFFYLLDEDNWYPRFSSSDDSHHELELTIPKDLAGIGVGERVSEETEGLMKRVVFRTTQPIDNSTFYYGDYSVEEKAAAGIKVELYVNRKDITEQKNARYTIGEITGALDYFGRAFCPLDIKTLRAATTPTTHARGFEGLILLGRAGTQTDDKYFADLSRAHEVAHQWWGNYVRHKQWPRDRWLYEGLADFSAMQYYKARLHDDGKAARAMAKRWVEPLTFGTRTREDLAGHRETLAGGSAYPLLAATDNVYTKGPMVLEMMRYLFSVETGSDEAFLEMLRDFLHTFRYRAAGGEEFKRMAENHMGESLDWFFAQWVEDGGIPVLVWHEETAERAGKWLVSLEARQEQREYRLHIPVHIHFPGGRTETYTWLIEGASGKASFEVAEKPSGVSLNDQYETLVILKRMKAL